MKVLLKVYEETKYTADEAKYRIEYEITGWRVATGEEAKAIEAETDGSCIDEYHEYLILEFADGDTSTFRNSHVDLMRQ